MPGHAQEPHENHASAVDQVRRSKVRWAVLAVVATTYFLGAADRANLAVALPYIRKTFHLTNTEAGAAASIFFIGVTLIQVPGSLLIQRLRVRSVMIISILLASVATAMSGAANTAGSLLVARGLLGVAEGPLPVGCLTTLNRWFPPKERATAVGIYVASFKLAPAFVPPIAAAIIYAFGWREVFYVFGAAGLLFVIMWAFVAEDPRESNTINSQELNYIENDGDDQECGHKPQISRPALDKFLRARRVEPLDTNRGILTELNIWGCAIAYFLMAGVNYTILTWIPTYLTDVKHYKLMTMGFVASSPWIGAVLGSIAGGLLSDRVFSERRKPVMLITAGASIFTTFALISAPDNPWPLSSLLFATGFLLNLGFSTYTVYPMGLATKERVPLAVSIVSAMGALGGGVAPVGVGYILDVADWNMAFMFLSLSAISALILVLLIREPLRNMSAAASAGSDSS